MFTSISGRSVLVTGGTKGIGQGLAAGFAAEGASVVIVGRDRDAGQRAAAELAASAGKPARSGITINAIMPGNIITEGLADLGPEYMQTMEAAIPLGRLGSIKEVASAALFLATEEAAYITGQTLVIDGGQTVPESLEAMG